MSAGSEMQSFTFYERLQAHLRTPLYRNGYMLTLSSLTTSAIGLIYWILVARRFPAYDVGINTAVISSMTFLASISEINLMSALIRFIPITGRSTRRFVLYAYLVSLAVAAIVSFVYIKNLAHWSPALKFLGEDPALMVWFTLSTMMWCIFVLQDSVLTGLRRASWVPLENTVFSLTKIALVVIFAVSLPALGIFASWSFALIVAILPTNYFIFRKLIPDHARQSHEVNGNVEPGQIVRYVAPDYLGTLFWIVCTTLMPVIVTTVAGATANAYFYLAWTIANTLYLIGPSMGSSMVVEAANNPQKLSIYSNRVFRNTIKLIFPATVIVAIGAPYLLMVFGKGYSSEGATLLRLLALSAIPSAINALFINVSRVQRRMVAVLAIQGSLYTMILALSYVLLKEIGITGVGIGWLVSQSIVAAIVYTTQLRNLWREPGKGNRRPGVALPGTGGMPSVIHFLHQMINRSGLAPFVTRLKRKCATRKRETRIFSLLPGILRTLPTEVYDPSRDDWEIQYLADNETASTIAFYGPPDTLPPIIIKLPGNSKEAESMKRQRENLASLNCIDQLGEWRELLPAVVFQGRVGGQVYYIERTMPGESMLSLFRKRRIDPAIISKAAAEISTLHRETAKTITIGKDLLDAWVNRPLKTLSLFTNHNTKSDNTQRAIELLEEELYVALEDQELCISWIHGDYSPANILVSPGGNKITGIVDWDLARPEALPMLDLMHLLLSIRMETERVELGQIVRSLLLHGNWKPEELQLIRKTQSDLPGKAIEIRALLLLSWLHHINANLSKTSRYDRHSLWITENILPVLQAV